MHRWGMFSNELRFETGTALIAGSFCDATALRGAGPGAVRNSCDVVEIRLDLLVAEGVHPDRGLWGHLKGIPLLFTARRIEEGGALASTAGQRMEWLESALDDAAAVDIETASLAEMAEVVEILRTRGIPLVASFHDFERTPSREMLLEKLEAAKASGAAVFKVAAWLHEPADLAALADFQKTDHGIPTATMGMGMLGPVSRLLCAQYGSVLNYGYLGKNPTAPGQWDAARLKDAIHALPAGGI